jgi:hypothetical protein
VTAGSAAIAAGLGGDPHRARLTQRDLSGRGPASPSGGAAANAPRTASRSGNGPAEPAVVETVVDACRVVRDDMHLDRIERRPVSRRGTGRA